jgi:hypothetical protein
MSVMPAQQLLDRVRELRDAGRTPKEIARALMMPPSAVAGTRGSWASSRTRTSSVPLATWGMGRECELTFGMDGKPMYISGPYDDSERIMRKLADGPGEENYHFVHAHSG